MNDTVNDNLSELVQGQNQVAMSSSGKRIDVVAAAMWPEFSREKIKQWIAAGDLQVDGGTWPAKKRVQGGEMVELNAFIEVQTEAQAENIPIDIVFEDDYVCVVNKPAGLVVHPAAGNRTGTLLNALLYYCPAQEALPRAGIVHRLDKDTTGLMVVAKTLQAHTSLVRQLQKKTVFREYLAVVNGVPTAGGSVDAPIGRHRQQRTRMAVVNSGKAAVTHYKLEEKYRAQSLLRCRLETGRTHQIRVHMSHIGYPLVGDRAYGGKPKPPVAASEGLRTQLQGFSRQALHARNLGLLHPNSGKEMLWQAPVPQDLQLLVDALKQDKDDFQAE